MSRVGPVRWVSALNVLNAATALGATNGVVIGDSRRHRFTHILATKSNVLDLDVYTVCTAPVGGTLTNVKAKADSISFAGSTDEVERIDGLTGVVAVELVRTDANQSNLGANIYLGTSEA